jgi:Holliday junction resolvase RusA-like endonuclease
MAHYEVRFTVHGTPQPKGSARAFVPKGWTRPVITSTNRNLKGWEATIRTEIQRVMSEKPRADLLAIFTAPVRVTLVFHLDRPKSAPRRVTLPITRPDLDKLTRGAIDALNGVLFKDDSQVVAIDARKCFADTGAKLEVVVESWTDVAPARQSLFLSAEEGEVNHATRP